MSLHGKPGPKPTLDKMDTMAEEGSVDRKVEGDEGRKEGLRTEGDSCGSYPLDAQLALAHVIPLPLCFYALHATLRRLQALET